MCLSCLLPFQGQTPISFADVALVGLLFIVAVYLAWSGLNSSSFVGVLNSSGSWHGFALFVTVTWVDFVRGCGCSFGSPLFALVFFGVMVKEPSRDLSSWLSEFWFLEFFARLYGRSRQCGHPVGA